MTEAQPFGANRIDVTRAWPQLPGVAPPARPRRITARLLGAMAAVLAVAKRPKRRAERPYYPPRRASFVEDAAMAREMLRL